MIGQVPSSPDIDEIIHNWQRLTAAIFSSSHEAIVLADSSGKIKEVNPAFGQITGYKDQIPRSLAAFLFGHPNEARLGKQVWHSLQTDHQWDGVCYARMSNGEFQRLKVRLLAVGRGKNDAGGIMAIFHVLRQESETADLLLIPNHIDSVTGLPNRVYFNQIVARRINANPAPDQLVSLLILNLDNFKNVNSYLGQSKGDELLKKIAQRLLTCVRSQDGVARLGDDEFGILLRGLKDVDAAAMAARRLLLALNDPVQVGERDIFISASVGVAIYPDHGNNAETLMHNANVAMRHAKTAGRHNFELFSPDMKAHSGDRLALESELRRALSLGQFEVHYQPLVEMQEGRIVGMEALVRWNRPGSDLVYPDQFIPLAEENGLILPIGEWVLTDASTQAQQWRQAGWPQLRLAVNLSARQLLWQHDIVEMVESVLKQTGLPPSALELEMTESVVMHNVEGAVVAMNRLSEKGVRLSLDDFGTGYSSLNYLKRFPLDTLKIDRSFTNDIPDDPDGVAIVEGILALARSLKLQVVAEGVEYQSQYEFLRRRGCDMMQGFLFSRPLPAEQFEALLRQGLKPTP